MKMNKLKSENKKLESSIEINKAKLEELENNIDTIAEIKDSKVSVNTATMNNVAKYINGESEAKIILGYFCPKRLNCKKLSSKYSAPLI